MSEHKAANILLQNEIERTYQALQEKERMLTTLISNLDGMVYRCRFDESWTLEYVSEGCEALTGYKPQELLYNQTISYEEVTHPDDRASVRSQIEAAVAEGRRFLLEYRIRHHSGEIKWVWERGVPVYDAHGAPIAVEGFIEDITERRATVQALLQAERSYRSIFEHTVEGIFRTTPEGRYLTANPALARIYGYESADELIANMTDLSKQLYVDVARREEFRRLMQENGMVVNFVAEAYRKNGERIWISENARAVYDENKKLQFYEGTVEDITEIRMNQEKLEFLANHDVVTRLPNRLLMNDRLRQMLRSAQRSHSVVAVALIDLDHFKLINDTYGHNAGDRLLQEMAARMESALRDTDTVARLGGDEFVLLLSGEGRGEALSQVLHRVLNEISRPWQFEEGRELTISCSIGVSLFPRDGRDVQTLLRNADTALYKAKELGRNNIQFYSSDMNQAIADKLEAQTILRHAVKHKQFVLLYQPKLDLTTGSIYGMEALLRINDAERGLLPPPEFIRIAEETGMIVQIGEWVMREACMFNKALQDLGLPALKIAINLSARQLLQPDLVDMIEHVLQDTKLDAKYLELELTESMLMHDPERMIATLEQIRALGVELTVDDFGTGYSSLSYLKRLPVSTLKVDKSFVHDLGQNVNAASIVKAVISLGHSLGLVVIAEGVETADQINFLRDHLCDSMQGYLFSRPLSGEQFKSLLEIEARNPDASGNLRRLGVLLQQQTTLVI